MNNQTHRGSMHISEIAIIILTAIACFILVAMFWVGHPVVAIAFVVVIIAAIAVVFVQHSQKIEEGATPGKRRL